MGIKSLLRSPSYTSRLICYFVILPLSLCLFLSLFTLLPSTVSFSLSPSICFPLLFPQRQGHGINFNDTCKLLVNIVIMSWDMEIPAKNNVPRQEKSFILKSFVDIKFLCTDGRLVCFLWQELL